MVKLGRYREAVEIIMQDLPFPGVLGRICPRGCEKSCRRLEMDEAISIRDLKRVAADHVKLSEIPVPDITRAMKRWPSSVPARPDSALLIFWPSTGIR